MRSYGSILSKKRYTDMELKILKREEIADVEKSWRRREAHGMEELTLVD
jgi:hypothetical protein